MCSGLNGPRLGVELPIPVIWPKKRSKNCLCDEFLDVMSVILCFMIEDVYFVRHQQGSRIK